MKKLYIVLALVALVAHAAAQLAEPVRWSVEQRRLSDALVELVFTGELDAGWHVYGSDIADGGPTCARLAFDRLEGARSSGPLEMRGKVWRGVDEMFGTEVSYMAGRAVFAQRLRITGPTYRMAGRLTYGACSSEACMPPSDVEFAFEGQGIKGDAADSLSAAPNPEDAQAEIDTLQMAVLETELWAPVADELQAFGDEALSRSLPLWKIFLLGLAGGLLALLTPCVWPIIPMTVSYFLKRSQSRSRGVRDAFIYGLSIVAIYLALGLLVTSVYGADQLNALSTNAFFNVFLFLLLVLFGASFLGGFEITLPGRWTNAVDRKSESAGGWLGIFLMATTLTLVSFSCTGPIIGFLLVEVSLLGNFVAPAVGMLGFALALALPFTLFALFPAWLKRVPRSGGWMNCVKVCLGFLELAFSLKFLSVADLAYGWHILDRETFLALWIVLFAMLGAYLVGWLRFPHDEDEYDEMGNLVQRPRTGIVRFFLATLSFAFALYMVPGLWGAPCKAVSAFAPPISTQDFRLAPSVVEARFTDYDEAMAVARAERKPVLLDFTGFGCVNCRKMEAAVWTDPRVAEVMNSRYVLVTLHVDDKTLLPEPIAVVENGARRTLRTVGDKWSYLQRIKFGANTQPFYVLLDNDGHPLSRSYSFDERISAWMDFLQEGLKRYK